jgi:hypothetical protein
MLDRRGGLFDCDAAARTVRKAGSAAQGPDLRHRYRRDGEGIARAALNPANVVKEVSPERLRRFFVHESGIYRVVKKPREMWIFSTHSVIRDPPFSGLDLISCRDLLIYLKRHHPVPFHW